MGQCEEVFWVSPQMQCFCIKDDGHGHGGDCKFDLGDGVEVEFGEAKISENNHWAGLYHQLHTELDQAKADLSIASDLYTEDAKALRTENANLKRANLDCVAYYESLKVDYDRMREALEPFARLDLMTMTQRPDTTYLWKPNSNTGECHGITVRNIMDAKAALEGES